MGCFLYGVLRAGRFSVEFDLGRCVFAMGFAAMLSAGVLVPLLVVLRASIEMRFVDAPRQRAEAGLCWECGYPRSADQACSECGQPRTPPSSPLPRGLLRSVVIVWIVGMLLGSLGAESALVMEDRRFLRNAETLHKTWTTTVITPRAWPWGDWALGKQRGLPVYVLD